MDDSDITGTRDSTYNVVSVLYHALQGAELYERYGEDAEDDEELAEFFETAQQQQRQIADQAKQLLAQRLNRQMG